MKGGRGKRGGEGGGGVSKLSIIICIKIKISMNGRSACNNKIDYSDNKHIEGRKEKCCIQSKRACVMQRNRKRKGVNTVLLLHTGRICNPPPPPPKKKKKKKKKRETTEMGGTRRRQEGNKKNHRIFAPELSCPMSNKIEKETRQVTFGARKSQPRQLLCYLDRE